jgi:hypothetical protein
MLDRFMRGGEIVAHLQQELTRQTLFRIVPDAALLADQPRPKLPSRHSSCAKRWYGSRIPFHIGDLPRYN